MKGMRLSIQDYHSLFIWDLEEIPMPLNKRTFMTNKMHFY